MLVKAGWHVMCDEVWVCTAREDMVVTRLHESRGMPAEEVQRRLAMQVDCRPYATRTFVTESTVEALHGKVDAALESVLGG